MIENSSVPEGPKFCTENCLNDVDGTVEATPSIVNDFSAVTFPELSTENDGVFVSGLKITFSGSPPLNR